MLTHYRSLTLVAALLLGALGCSDDSEDEGCRGIDDDGDGFILKCAGPIPDYDSGPGIGGKGGRGGSGGSGGSGGKDAGDDLDGGNDADASTN